MSGNLENIEAAQLIAGLSTNRVRCYAVLQMSAIALAVILRCGLNVKGRTLGAGPRNSIVSASSDQNLAKKGVNLLTIRHGLGGRQDEATKGCLTELLSWHCPLDLLSNNTIQFKSGISL
jgi:hypothetical protein